MELDHPWSPRPRPRSRPLLGVLRFRGHWVAKRLAFAPKLFEHSQCCRPRAKCWRHSREPEGLSPRSLHQGRWRKASYCLITVVISATKQSTEGKERVCGQEACPQAVICLPSGQRLGVGLRPHKTLGSFQQLKLSLNRSGRWGELWQLRPPPPLAGVRFLELSVGLVSPVPLAHLRTPRGTALNPPCGVTEVMAEWPPGDRACFKLN